jgi:hypothetical protein
MLGLSSYRHSTGQRAKRTQPSPWHVLTSFPHTLASLLECITSFVFSYRLQHVNPHSIGQQCVPQVRHTPFIHRISGEKNNFFFIFLPHPHCPFVCPILTCISFLSFSVKTDDLQLHIQDHTVLNRAVVSRESTW